MKSAGWCSIVVGVLMLAQWAFFLAAGRVPEVRSAPIALGFHLAAELGTAALLFISGVMLVKGRAAAAPLGLVANGMLLYTIVVSPGYFAQLGQWPLVGMFAVILGVAVFSAIQLARVASRSTPG